MTDGPTTPAIDALVAAGVPHRVVRTERASSAEESARFQGISTHQLLRTLVVRRGEGDHLLVLVPGGRRFDWSKLRAHLGVTRLSMPDADEARAVTGYERGTITPFGTRQQLPVILDQAGTEPDVVALGGGAHGVNVHLTPADLVSATGATVADIAVDEVQQHD